jgi:hypothetical protein
MNRSSIPPSHPSNFTTLTLLLFALPCSVAAAPSGTISGNVEVPETLASHLSNRGYASLYRKAATPPVHGLEDVVVYLESVPGTHPAPERNAVTRHKAQDFSPRVLPVLKGQRLVVASDDPYDHVLSSDSRRNPPFRRRLQSGGPPLIYRTVAAETFIISCSGHLRSWCHVLVLQNPFYAVPARNGSYQLKDVPPGSYVLWAWHPDFAPVSTRVTVLARREVAVNPIFEKVRYAP